MENLNKTNVNASGFEYAEDFAQMQKRYFEAKQREEYFARRKFNRTPLILALIGLLLTFAFGLGIAFAIPALIVGAKRYLKAPSKPLRWAIVLSIVTIVICLVYAFCLGYAIVVGFIELSNLPVV